MQMSAYHQIPAGAMQVFGLNQSIGPDKCWSNMNLDCWIKKGIKKARLVYFLKEFRAHSQSTRWDISLNSFDPHVILEDQYLPK